MSDVVSSRRLNSDADDQFGCSISIVLTEKSRMHHLDRDTFTKVMQDVWRCCWLCPGDTKLYAVGMRCRTPVCTSDAHACIHVIGNAPDASANAYADASGNQADAVADATAEAFLIASEASHNETASKQLLLRSTAWRARPMDADLDPAPAMRVKR